MMILSLNFLGLLDFLMAMVKSVSDKLWELFLWLHENILDCSKLTIKIRLIFREKIFEKFLYEK